MSISSFIKNKLGQVFTINELIESTGIEPSNAYDLLRQLERWGYITRVSSHKYYVVKYKVVDT